MRKTVVFGIVIGVLILAGLAWRLWPRAQDKPRVLATEPVVRGTVRKELEATGIVKAQVGAIVKIGAQATGRITRMLVKVGDRVAQGDLIAEIDSRELAASRRESRARLDSARAELTRVRTVYPLSVAEAQANLESARAEADYAVANLGRQERLFEAGLIAKDTLDDARQSAEVKAGALNARQAALDRARAESDQELTKAQKGVVQAEAALASIATRISYTRIISPISGLVSQVTAQEGETVVAGLQVANLITVLDPSRLEMWIYVDETDVGQVAPGLAVEFFVDAFPERTFSGSVAQIYPEPEIRDNIVYYQALVALDRDQAEALRPEMTTQCRIVVQEKRDVLSLPNAALKWVDNEQSVFVVQDGRVSRVQPELGLTGLTHSEVLSGLAEGQTVATQLVLPSAKSGKSKGQTP